MVDTTRVNEVTRRHRLIREFLNREDYAALLLQNPANFSWLTVGGQNQRGGSTGQTGALFVTPDARVIVCSNSETAQYFEADIPGLGFQLKERPWFEPKAVMVSDLCRGRRVASDTGLKGTDDVSLMLLGMRLPLTDYDTELTREAGRLVTHAVEATARTLTRGRTEAEIAGEIAHRLLKHGVYPDEFKSLVMVAAGDSDIGRSIRQTFIVTARSRWFGRYQGLHVGVARTVSFGAAPPELLAAFEPAALVAATGIYFSQPEWELFEVWNRVQRLYEKSGAAAEWRLADQADVVEYAFGSVPLMPTSEFRLTAGTPVFWHPSVGPAVMGDTVLVTKDGTEIITPARDWPTVPISVKGVNIEIPAILVVDQ